MHRRTEIKNQILHEDDRIYYCRINDLDLTDVNIIPYVSHIQYTITTLKVL